MQSRHIVLKPVGWEAAVAAAVPLGSLSALPLDRGVHLHPFYHLTLHSC